MPTHYQLIAQRMVGLSLMIASLVVAPRVAQAATYYVATNGLDSRSCTTAQTIGTPKLTLVSAVQCLSAGDTLWIRGGNYSGINNILSDSKPSCTPNCIRGGRDFGAGAITIGAYAPGGVPEVVTVSPTGDQAGIDLESATQKYIIFQDFIIDAIGQTPAASGGGVYMSGGANHIRFLRIEVKNVWGNGFHISNNNGTANFNEIISSKLHDNGRSPCHNSGYGIYAFTDHNLIEKNEIYNNNGYGIHLYNDNGPFAVSNNIVRKNSIHDNHNRVADTASCSGNSAAGIVIAWGDGNQVYNNLIYGNQGGINVYTNSSNTLIYNNTIYNNTAYPAGAQAGIRLQYYAAGAAVVRNNIVYNNVSGVVDMGGTGTPTIDHNLTANPLVVDAAASNFHVQAGSAAINAGVTLSQVSDDYDGVLRPQGGAYDIGAFEYTSTGVMVPQHFRLSSQ